MSKLLSATHFPAHGQSFALLPSSSHTIIYTCAQCPSARISQSATFISLCIPYFLCSPTHSFFVSVLCLFMHSHTPLESFEATSTVVDFVAYGAASTRQGTCPYLQLCMQTPGSRRKMTAFSASCMIGASLLCTSHAWTLRGQNCSGRPRTVWNGVVLFDIHKLKLNR